MALLERDVVRKLPVARAQAAPFHDVDAKLSGRAGRGLGCVPVLLIHQLQRLGHGGHLWVSRLGASRCGQHQNGEGGNDRAIQAACFLLGVRRSLTDAPLIATHKLGNRLIRR
ncbi:hypothetical protein GALL_432190 [mine drainage metagenome]|uniref:Uncharacterized protein n=1 Tax=mine drainage metagenome TaxID=410659 RepID=A0A1J5QCA2_9ZZZZ